MSADDEGKPRYRRALIKLSGEALMGGQPYGVDPQTLARFAADIVDAAALGVEICLVVGGGNIYRGLAGAAQGMDRVTADYMGMLATVMNALALQQALTKAGAEAVTYSALPMNAVCETFQRQRAVSDMRRGRTVIFAGGTGSPFFTTDTTAALRAAEMGCDAILKATRVDGVYSADPRQAPDAVRYERLSYREALARDLKVMDGAAIALARDNGIPIVVFSLADPGNIAKVLTGRLRCTIVGED